MTMLSEFARDRLNELVEMSNGLMEAGDELGAATINLIVFSYLDEQSRARFIPQHRHWDIDAAELEPVVIGDTPRRGQNRGGRTGYDLLSKLMGVLAIVAICGYTAPNWARFFI